MQVGIGYLRTGSGEPKEMQSIMNECELKTEVNSLEYRSKRIMLVGLGHIVKGRGLQWKTSL